MQDTGRKNPWLGLESYKEGDILYGRDDDIRDLSQCILSDTGTLLYGKSGIGKSSILNAGILPAARRNGYLPVLIRLSHKGKDSYLYQINQSIINAILDNCDSNLTVETISEIDFSELIKEVVPQNNSGTESLYEYFHRHTFLDVNGNRIKLLIIFDQFEEIFTLQESAQKRKSFFSDFADVLNDIMPDELQKKVDIPSDRQKDVAIIQDENFENFFDDLNLEIENNIPEYITDNEIHFVFTIREDFLSEFEYYSAAIPSLKQNRYGLRLINEEQAAQIILQPVPGLIDKSVAKLIIEKITEKKDFKLDGIPEIEVDSAVLSIYLNRLYEAKNGDLITENLVEQKGGEIISDFYKDAISGISDSTVEYLEDMLLNGQERRDNITVYDAIHDGNVSEYELDVLCDKKKVLRRFNYSGDLRIEYIHDILCPIVAKNKSERQERKEKERQNEELKKIRKQRSMTLSCIVLLLGCIAFYIIGYIIPVSDRFASTTKEWGNFVGIEPLSKEEASYRQYHFVLNKQGLFTRTYSSMECRDRFNNLCKDHGMKPYLTNSQLDSLVDDFKEKYQTVCQWKLIKDPIDKKLVIQERGYDKDDNLVYALNYNSPQKPEEPGDFKVYLERTRIGSYVDEQGLPVELLRSGYRFVQITYDDKGRDILVEYFDSEGNPSTNADGAYQTYYEYDDAGHTISISSLNMYGKRMIDNAGNCGQVNKYDGDRLVEILSVDEFGREKAVKSGYSRATFEYDDKGRETIVSLWNKNEPVCDEFGCHLRETSYDDNSNAIALRLYNSEGEQISSQDIAFDHNGNVLSYNEWNANEETTIIKSRFVKNELVYKNQILIEGIDTIGVYTYEKNGKIETRKYTGKIYKEYINQTTYDESDRIIEDVYFELDGRTPYEDEVVWHKVACFYTHNGYDKKSLFYIKKDSLVYYHRDGIDKIKVSKRYPNRNYVEEETYTYKEDTIEHSELKKQEDSYGNVIEEWRGGDKVYYFVNARTKKRTGNAVGYLSRYKFPLRDFEYYDRAHDKWYTCDENGNIDVPADYTLPEMYSGTRENTAVFIECTDQGRIWQGVILTSQRGVCYGDENYSYDCFSGMDELLCLNLTSMRVEKLVPDALDYWTIYPGFITNPQNSFFREFYIKATKNDHKEY